VILFDRLRDYLGDRRFFSGLKEYTKRYAGKIAAPAELASCFGGGRDAAELMQSFLGGKCVI